MTRGGDATFRSAVLMQEVSVTLGLRVGCLLFIVHSSSLSRNVYQSDLPKGIISNVLNEY